MKINWTNIIVTISVVLIVWLFVPSPLHKCPAPTLLGTRDSTIVVPGDTIMHVEVIPPIASSETSEVPIDVAEVSGVDEEGEEWSQRTLTFSKETVKPLPEGTEARFRSTTYWTLGDSTAQIIHEIVIPPRAIEYYKTTDTVKTFVIQEVAMPEEPTPVLESPVFWAVAGAVIGGIVMGIFISNNKKD